MHIFKETRDGPKSNKPYWIHFYSQIRLHYVDLHIDDFMNKS